MTFPTNGGRGVGFSEVGLELNGAAVAERRRLAVGSWVLALLSGANADSSAIFAFAPNGQGGAVWRPLTNIPRQTAPGVIEGLPATAPPVLPTGASDAFASFPIVESVYDGTAWSDTYKVVRFANPFTRPAGSVTLDQLQTLVAGGPNAGLGQHTWSPDAGELAYIGRNWYPDGASKGALRLLDLATGADVCLLDTNTIGVQPNRPRWSPGGGEVAFDSNTGTSSTSGTYAVALATGAVRAVATRGSGTQFYRAPVSSPDNGALAVTDTHVGSQASLRNCGRITRLPSAGVTKKSGPVPLTAYSATYQLTYPLGWR